MKLAIDGVSKLYKGKMWVRSLRLPRWESGTIPSANS